MKLSFEHISKLYGNTAALQQIDLTLGSGVYGLLGPNGAGKTTLMRIMTDLLAPSTGRVLLDGQDIAVMGAAFRKKLGYLPQDFGVYPNFTAEQFLLYIARLKGLSKFEAKRQTDGLLHMVGLEDKKQKKLKGFSGGQRQRVGIAQAIVHNPKFVVLDEPTNGLDPNQIVEVRHLIKEIAEERSVLLSTHILSEVQATCEEIKMIEQGQLVFSGTLDQFDNYIQPNTIMVTLANPPAEASLIWEGVSNVERVTDHRFRLRYDGCRETARRVAEQSVNRGWGLEELVVEKSSMDEVFAKLSGKANGEGKR